MYDYFYYLFSHWSDPLPAPSILRNLKIVGFSDGGLRKEVLKAATGWTIVAIENGKAWLLGSGGMLVKCGEAGSFLVEALALEALINELTVLCKSSGVLDNSWQNTALQFSRDKLLVLGRN